MEIPEEGNRVFVWDNVAEAFDNLPLTKPTILLTFEKGRVTKLDWLQAEDYIDEYKNDDTRITKAAFALMNSINTAASCRDRG